MGNNDKNKQTDAKKFAEIVNTIKKDSQLYGYISVAMQSYIDGLKAAVNCKKIAQSKN